VAKKPPSDWAYIARKINELAPGQQPTKPRPAAPPQPTEPQLVEVRPYLEPTRVEPEPQPVAIAPPPEVLTRPASRPEPADDQQLNRLLALWPKLTQREREELIQIARLKIHLNSK